MRGMKLVNVWDVDRPLLNNIVPTNGDQPLSGLVSAEKLKSMAT